MTPQQLSARLELAQVKEQLALAIYSGNVLKGLGEVPEPFTATDLGLFEAIAARQHFQTLAVDGRDRRVIFVHLPAVGLLAYAIRHPDGIILTSQVGETEPFIGLFPNVAAVAEQMAAALFEITATLLEPNRQHRSQTRH